MHILSSKIRKWADSALKVIANEGHYDGVERRHLVTCAVAVMVAYRLPIPSASLNRPREWYVTNALATTENFIGSLVEYLTMDVEGAMRLAETMWLMRYRVVHEPASPQARGAILASLGGSPYEIPLAYRNAVALMNNARTGDADIMGLLLQCDGDIKQAIPQHDEEPEGAVEHE